MKKTRLVIMVALLVGLIPGLSFADPTFVTSTTSNGHTYALYTYSAEDISNEDNTWYMAAGSAEALGENWNLATITSQTEQVIVATLIYGQGTEFWLGGYSNADANHDVWYWITGEDMSYENWNEGEPNNCYGDNSELYMGIWANSSWDYWNDEGALGNISGFVAEYTPAPVPEPATLMLLGSGLLGLAAFRRKKQ